MGVRLHVWGERACFTRPEMKVERVSYDVITPSAARGILESIHWKPAIRWTVTRLQVLNRIRFETIRRNEIASVISEGTARRAMNAGSLHGLGLDVTDARMQRATVALKDVAYVIEARFERTSRWGKQDTDAKHIDMFTRRARKGQCFHRPCLGTREFDAHFALLEDGDDVPMGTLAAEESDRDLGWMLHDVDYETRSPRFFRATMENGAIDVPPFGEVG